jgi:hypothetical protein
MRAIGLLLVVLGIAALAYGGITWVRKDTVVDIGSVEITRDKHESLPLPPVVGIVMLLTGGVMLMMRPSR